MTLNPLRVLKESSRITAGAIAGLVVAAPASLVVARTIGPEALGMVGFLQLWSFYATFLRPGIFNAAARRLPPLLAQGKHEEATAVQNLAVSAETLYTIVPVAAMLATALLFEEPLLRYGMAITAASYGLLTFQSHLTDLHWAHQRYGLIAKGTVLMKAGTPLLSLALLPWTGAYALLLAPPLAALTVLGMYRFRAPSLGLQISFLRFSRGAGLHALKVLLGTGLPLALGNLFYWGFRGVDRVAVTTWTSFTDLGYYVFALTLVSFALTALGDFGNVLQIRLWGEMGLRSAAGLSSEITAATTVLMLLAGTGAAFGQAWFGGLVLTLAPQFAPSIPVFEVLTLLLPCCCLALVPNMLLRSEAIDRGRAWMAVWGLGAALNAGLMLLAFAAGKGDLVTVAWAACGANVVVAAALWSLAHRHLFERPAGAMRCYGWMGGVALVSLGIYVSFQSYPLLKGEADLFQATVLRTVVAGVVWAILAGIAWVMLRPPRVGTTTAYSARAT